MGGAESKDPVGFTKDVAPETHGVLRLRAFRCANRRFAQDDTRLIGNTVWKSL